MLIVLWTDFLLWALALVASLGIYLTYRNPYKRQAWHKIYNSPLKMLALIILLVFVAIGLLDSIHYQPPKTNQVISVLDIMFGSRAIDTETSYSAPFATKLLNEQMEVDPGGKIVLRNPQLQYVSPVNNYYLALIAFAQALIIWLTIVVIIRSIIKLKKIKLPRSLPRRAFIYSLLGIIVFITLCINFGGHYHILGTNKIGIDVFYATIKSIRTGLVIGTLTTVITMPFAVLLGCLAGFCRGWIDDAIQYLYTVVSSIPAVLLIAASVLMFDVVLQRHQEFFSLHDQQTDARLLLLCAILGLTSWTSLCRILRGETLKLRDQEFVLAAKTLGLNTTKIILKHIVPNLWHIILITIVLDFSGLVLAEAVLSYVGVGVDPSTFSWGTMINSARLEMAREPAIWWSLFGAFAFMFSMVLAANIVADGVQDAFNPKAN